MHDVQAKLVLSRFEAQVPGRPPGQRRRSEWQYQTSVGRSARAK
eukprot:CAMPEP_0204056200 /NCGR_PEP_ID=MMETSP0360-20130528/131892_1 /ASSEMBLY_ACC=CAM_ASM_000342 /TAXON_ID=268821 /ORGANISM="Scrippsiella Hangoei, Strain SHTV-5" /LENGTH=43 /DNA_ID= /DNA_START= /DNA_END= /DNA_ORIENTATION=